jgi:cell division septation protein DedD
VVAAGGKTWAVHVVSMRTDETARKEAERFTAAGFPVAFRDTDVPGKGRWVRVYVGPFENREAAEAAARRVTESGVHDYTQVHHVAVEDLRAAPGREDR